MCVKGVNQPCFDHSITLGTKNAEADVARRSIGIIPSLQEDNEMVKGGPAVSLLCVIGLQPGQGGGSAALRYLLLHLRHTGELWFSQCWPYG